MCGWENGDLHLWNGGADFISVSSPHQGIAITILLWSHRGGRLVSADAVGELFMVPCTLHQTATTDFLFFL